MKKILFFLLMFVCIPSHSQWVQQNSASSLNDVYCLSEEIVIAAGDSGTILKTTNGGTDWTGKASGTSLDLSTIEFAGENVGYIIGTNAANGTTILLKTIDAGENWLPVTAAETSSIRDIACINDNLFYVSASDGTLKKSIDGGITFMSVTSDYYIDAIQFISELVGYAASANMLLRTSDGGTTWSSIGTIDYESGYYPFFFVNDQVGYKKSSDNLYKTNDGGTNWSLLTTISHTTSKLFASTENIIWGVTGILYLNGQPNYTMRGALSENGEFQRIDNQNPLFKAIFFANATVGYGVGWDGIFKNTTGTLLNLVENTQTHDITIHPNPATDQITINLVELPQKPVGIQIASIEGRIIYTQSFQNENTITISTASFSKGIYFLTVGHNPRQTHKFIVK